MRGCWWFLEALGDLPFVGRFVRRLVGGHWECWYVDSPVNSAVWHSVERCSLVAGTRPSGICRGTPTCEDW